MKNKFLPHIVAKKLIESDNACTEIFKRSINEIREQILIRNAKNIASKYAKKA